ncbi:MAG: RnfH family protein [Pseudohongiellaceae bacterium]
METEAKIEVEVAYADQDEQLIIPLYVPAGTTALEAARQSGITQTFAGLDLESSPMGIFSTPLNGKGKPTPDQYVLKAGDRVEIYRPLLINPKEARRQRSTGKG